MTNISFNFFNWLWLLPILSGLSLFAAIFYYRNRTKQLREAIQRLYKVNVDVEQDALNFLPEVWPVLRGFNICKFNISGNWFGEMVELEFSSDTKGSICNNYTVIEQDIHFKLQFYRNNQKAEERIITDVVLQTFLHIFKSNINLKQMQVLNAITQLERYQLHLQHDLKNLNQGMQLMKEQVEKLNSFDHDKFIAYIKQTIPILTKQANALLDPLSNKQEDFKGNSIDLFLLLEKQLKSMEINFSMQNTLKHEINLPEKILIEVFKNILGNYRDHSVLQGAKVNISFTENDTEMIVLIRSPNVLNTELTPERMFEPFWTTSSSGMGLGLFLAREVLKQINGSVVLWNSYTDYGFKVKLPVTN